MQLYYLQSFIEWCGSESYVQYKQFIDVISFLCTWIRQPLFLDLDAWRAVVFCECHHVS